MIKNEELNSVFDSASNNVTAPSMLSNLLAVWGGVAEYDDRDVVAGDAAGEA